MRDFMRVDLATISEVVVREDVSGGLIIGQSVRGEEFQIFLNEAALEDLETLLASALVTATKKGPSN